MSGWKDWAIGEVVTESEFQSFVQDQVVQRYADATERDSTLGANVAEGMIAYLEDTQKVQVYDGASWVDVGQEGDITSVTAGNALTGGGTSGDVTLNVDESAIEIPVAQISDLTASASELNTLDGITASTTELNYTDGVTSSIQDQLDDKADNSDFTGGTEGYTAVSNGASGLSYQPISHNYVINGAFDIWQRGTSFTSTLAGDYGADRWQHYRTDSVHSRVTSTLDNFEYAYRIQRPSGETFTGGIFIGQGIETANCLSLVGETFVVSYYARAGANFSGGSLESRVQVTPNDNAASVGSPDRETVTTDAASVTTSWQRFTYTATIPTTTGGSPVRSVGLQFFYNPTGTAGSDDWVEITGVQLEAGSIATPFKRNANSIQGELAACQRYYQRVSGTRLSNFGTARNTTSARIPFPTVVPFRVTPTSYDAANLNLDDTTGSTAVTSISILSNANETVQILGVNVASGLTQFRNYYLVNTSDNGVLGLSAEL